MKKLSYFLCFFTLFVRMVETKSASAIIIWTYFFRLEWLEIKEVTCTLGGAWCASFVIPLDWDRPWQVKSKCFLVD